MAEQEEDFSSLPLTQRFVHKNWKVRKEAYEAAAQEFDHAQTESDPIVKQFTNDTSLWKGAVTDSNVAAHQEGINALCSYLQIAGSTGSQRTRGTTIAPLAEKGLPSAKPAAKQKATEALLLYIELDKAEPVIEELLPFLSHKVPKTITATLAALTAIFHAYGCKVVNPRPVLAALPKIYGHADKNVRAEAQTLTVELYRWLRDGMKPMFWNDLKPVQQTDLEKLFDKVKDEPAPKQERLLRSQQEAAAAAPPPASGAADGDEGGYDEEAEGGFEPELMSINVFPKIPKDFGERLASTKWKDRKEALDDLQHAIDVPAIEEGPFDEIARGLAKSMKDANIAVVTVAANCIESLAKGLRKSFAKYRSIVFSPIMERLKERKQSVTDALAAALDAICASTSIPDCLEDSLGFLGHKNPLVKLEATRFLVRNLKATKTAPSIPDVKSISDASVKLLSDSQDNQRNAAAEVLGVLLKIMGDRVMNVHLDALDDIRKAKIKEYCDQAEVKSRYKPKAAPAPKGAPTPAQKKPVAAKKAVGAAPPKKAAAPAPPVDDDPPTPLRPKPTAKPGLRPPGASAPRGLKPPGATGSVRKLAAPGSGAPPASPRRAPAPQILEDESPPPAPRAPPSRGLAGRQLAKPQAPAEVAPRDRPVTSINQPLPSIEKIELEELRAETERLRSSNEALRAEQLKFSSQVTELQNQNAQLIEDHTRDVLSIKAKETQLVRARSDAEAAEANSVSLQREVERLKRELGRMGRAQSPRASEYGAADIFQRSSLSTPGSRASVAVMPSAAAASREGKENARPSSGSDKDGRVLSPPLHADYSSAASLQRAGSASPRRMMARPQTMPPPANGLNNSHGSSGGLLSDSDARSSATSSSSHPGPNGDANGGEGVESWKRAAEVTQNLKARIELMKQRQQGMRRA